MRLQFFNRFIIYAFDKRSSSCEHLSLDLFICYKEENVPEPNSHEVCNESLVESERSLVPHDLKEAVGEAIVNLASASIHNSGFHYIDRGPNAAGGEPGRETAEEVSK